MKPNLKKLNKIKKSKLTLSKSMFVAILAVLINIITVSVYIYQTHIMQSQQHASVWPYIEWRGVYNQESGYKLYVTNNGIGPALVKRATFYVKDKSVSHPDSLIVQLLGTDRFPHITNYVENRVIPAGETITMISVKRSEQAELLYIHQMNEKFDYKICYESIYGDAWISTGTKVEEGACD